MRVRDRRSGRGRGETLDSWPNVSTNLVGRGFGHVLANGPLHGARSLGPCDRGRARLPRQVGIAWSPHPTDEEVREEYERLWQQLGSRPIESLFDLPAMSDPETRLTIDVLCELQGSSHWMDQNLEHLLLLRMANLSMQHGNTDASTVAYAYLSLVVGVRFGQYAAAYRFGLLAIDLVDKKRLDRANWRVYWGVGAWVVPWVRHLREARPVLRRSLQSCENWRPLPHYLMWISSTLVTHGLASGESLRGCAPRSRGGTTDGHARSAQRCAARFHDGATRFHPDAAGVDPRLRIV